MPPKRLHAGDIGYMDADGFVTLVDPKKDMILSGGCNVFPRNIEEAIYEHPAVGVSFYDLIGAGEQRGRHGEAEGFGGLEINDQLEFGRLLDRNISRFHSFEGP